jgi:hypothetical protein
LSWHCSFNTSEIKEANDAFGVSLALKTDLQHKVKHHGRNLMKQAWLQSIFLLATLFSAAYASAQSLELAPTAANQPAIGSVELRSYELQAFARDEQDAIMWQQRYAAAPSGSWDESYARDQRDQAIQRALNDINSPDAFQGLMTSQIEDFAEQMNQKYNAAPSGSALERLYMQSRQTAYAAFKQSLLNDMQNLSYDWRRLHDLALRMDQGYNAAPSGSAKEAAYNEARRMAYQQLPAAVDSELPRYSDFRQVEQLALYFEQLFNQAPSGSLKESTYRQIEIRVFNEAGNRAQYELSRYPQQTLFQIQDEYNQKFNSAPSGSLKESYFRRVRDTARGLLGYHP